MMTVTAVSDEAEAVDGFITALAFLLVGAKVMNVPTDKIREILGGVAAGNPPDSYKKQ